MEDYGGFEPQVGEIRALRTFRIGPGGVLYPLFHDGPWHDGANTAICKLAAADPSSDRFDEYHIAPEPSCTCGYYAYANAENTTEQAHARHVLGVVACWGKVIAGTRGVRAQHARIEALWMSDVVPADLSNSVTQQYPSTAIYRDQAAMIAQYPPTPLDCYEPPTPPISSRRRLIWWGAILAALIVATLPADLSWQHQFARIGWIAGLLPIMQVGSLGLIQRRQLSREARRFPARIASLEPSRRRVRSARPRRSFSGLLRWASRP
jgi:hypothetical protein